MFSISFIVVIDFCYYDFLPVFFTLSSCVAFVLLDEYCY